MNLPKMVSNSLIIINYLLNLDGNLTRNQVLRFLSSFLTLILSINQEACELPGYSLYSIVNTCCSSIVDSIYSSIYKDSEDTTITFEDFSNWYTHYGGNEIGKTYIYILIYILKLILFFFSLGLFYKFL